MSRKPCRHERGILRRVSEALAGEPLREHPARDRAGEVFTILLSDRAVLILYIMKLGKATVAGFGRHGLLT
jgi:hypothetical protein